MSYGRHVWSYRFLRWGLGIVFIWIGVNIIQYPDAWIGYVPDNLPAALSRTLVLKLGGIFDIAVGIFFILGWWPKVIAILAALHLAGILFDQGIDAVLIRDVGLLGACLALLAWPKRRYGQN